MIVLIDNEGSFTYNMQQTLAKFYVSLEIINYPLLNVDEVRQLRPMAIILCSGPGIPQEYPKMSMLIRELAPTVPLLGVSLGHWALAEAFGAKIEPVKSFDQGKAIAISHRGEDIFAHLPNPMLGGCFHAFVVSKEHFPQDLAVLAEDKSGLIMSLRHRTYPAFGVQFYPESVLTPQGGLLLKNFVELAKKG